MDGLSALVLLFLGCLFFLPTIIVIKRKHPYKVPIILINIIGGLFWGIGWLVSLVWSFILPKDSNVAEEVEKLHSLKEQGIISEFEFETKKSKLINS